MKESNLNKYQVVIFDLDGTLVNTIVDLANSTNYALDRLGYPLRSIEEITQFVGNGIKKLIERALPDNAKNRVDDALEIFKEYYFKHCCDNVIVYEGIYDLLDFLKARHIKLAVVTNKNQTATDQIIRCFFDNYFDVVVGETKNLPKKPHSDMCDAVINKFNVPKSSCIFIGDSDVDIQTAKNTGIESISVSWGFRSIEFLKKNKAMSIVDSPRELLSKIS